MPIYGENMHFRQKMAEKISLNRPFPMYFCPKNSIPGAKNENFPCFFNPDKNDEKVKLAEFLGKNTSDMVLDHLRCIFAQNSANFTLKCFEIDHRSIFLNLLAFFDHFLTKMHISALGNDKRLKICLGVLQTFI